MPYVVDHDNQKAVLLHQRLSAHVTEAELPADLVVVMGGDGTMLRAIRAEHGVGRTFLGLNCGHVGFLLNEIPDSVEALAEGLRGQDYECIAFPQLAMTAVDIDGRCHQATALNDVYLERMGQQTCHLKLSIDDGDVVSRLICDGVIVSTALGSTAYNYSAGGLVCHPLLRVTTLTPICPHRPRLSPLVLAIDSHIGIGAVDPDRRPVRAVADGVEYAHVTHVDVTHALDEVRIAFFHGHDFTGALVRKILLPTAR